ncbi:hypothetical protein B0H63DRAFT_56575 [Podospora didyma]|uniref:Uncharacterized protein n=1 Tax=Podospora didyma TaxID=330526 RepID=A0AAE0P7G4_9PEZI|nr:hypothetical protein B0H63DRAFT_56575 [Podospora didyma]
MDEHIPEPPTSDGLPRSLASSWTNFLSVQYNSREVALLKRAVGGHAKEINASITSLQQGISRNQEIVAAATSEFKAKSEQITLDLAEIRPLRESFTLLQQEANQNKEQASSQISELTSKLMTLQHELGLAKDATTHDIENIRQQSRYAQDQICLLQDEIRGLKAEKISTERDLSALKSQLDSTIQSLNEVGLLQPQIHELKADKLSVDERLAALERQLNATTESLGIIELLQNELKELKAKKTTAGQTTSASWRRVGAAAEACQQPTTDAMPTADDMPTTEGIPTTEDTDIDTLFPQRGESPRPVARSVSGESIKSTIYGAFPSRLYSPNSQSKPRSKVENRGRTAVAANPQTSKSRKRKADDSQLPTEPKRTRNPNNAQDIRSRFLSFHEDYKNNKPTSDRDFIWKFLDGIENPNTSKYIQESVAAILPGPVSIKRAMRQVNRQRYVNISPSITWRDFRHACTKISPHDQEHDLGSTVIQQLDEVTTRSLPRPFSA